VVSTPAADANTAVRPAARPRHRALVGGLVASTVILVALGFTPAGALDRLPGPWHQATGPAPAVVADDEATCVAPSPPPTTVAATAAASGASVSQTVTLVVPPIVRVLDATATTLTVRTNAARPPAPGDLVWVRQADDSYVAADAAMVQRVLSATWSDASWCSTTAAHTSIG
jgi:hypothetical protein